MTSDSHMAPIYVDLDEVLRNWATGILGENQVLDDLDGSNVKIVQADAVYDETDSKLFGYKEYHSELYESDTTLPITWNYSTSVQYPSRGKWTMRKGLISQLVFLPQVQIRLPSFSAKSQGSVVGAMDLSAASFQPLEVLESPSWNLQAHVTVQPYSSSRACAEVCVCQAAALSFKVDLYISGSLKVVAHRKRKNWSKEEITTDICDALKDNPQFTIKQFSRGRRAAVFTLEGMCDIDYGLQAKVNILDLQTLV